MSRLAILLALAGVAQADVSVGDKAAGKNRCLEWPLKFWQAPDQEVFDQPVELRLRDADRAIFRAQMVDSVSPDPMWREALAHLQKIGRPGRYADLIMYEAGRIELELRDAEHGAEHLDTVASRFPRSPYAVPAMILVGDWHQRAGDPLRARRYWHFAGALDEKGACAFELKKRLNK